MSELKLAAQILNETKEILMNKGVAGQRIYGCDEWAAPVQNINQVLNLLNAHNEQWISVTDRLPEQNTAVLGWSSEWIDDDFNQEGIRECFLNGESSWVSSKWFDYQDCYESDEATRPEKWMPLPTPPNDEEA